MSEPFIPVSEWTDEEWERIITEFNPITHAHVIAEAVYRRRQRVALQNEAVTLYEYEGTS